MAKRAVRRDRRRTEPGAPAPAEAPPAAPPWRTRAFWLGGAAIGSIVAVVAVVVLLASGGDDQQPRAAVEATPTPATIDVEGKTPEQLAEEFRQRDLAQIEDLTAGARRTAEKLTPVVEAFTDALPPKGGGRQADADTIDGWIATVREEAAPFEESISGETATNVARSALGASIGSLLESLEVYRLAAASEGDRAALQERARSQRDVALRTWSTATTQIDYVNIVAGFGHQHVPQIGGGAPPDTLPEGTDARPHSD